MNHGGQNRLKIGSIFNLGNARFILLIWILMLLNPAIELKKVTYSDTWAIPATPSPRHRIFILAFTQVAQLIQNLF